MFPKDNKIQSHENDTLTTEPDSYISFDSYDRVRPQSATNRVIAKVIYLQPWE